jgi:O-acetyl-ADP-ribose deacetylase
MSAFTIKLIQSDITKLDVDVIVNAANSSLLGGGGVDGAIHRAAGPLLLEECRKLGGCPAGNARITRGYELKARYVVHTVGPVWHGGKSGEPELLSSCYSTSMQLAVNLQCSTIAFPNISTGIYGYPKPEAAKIAIATVKEFLLSNHSLLQVIFCCFDTENFTIYTHLLNA